MAYKMVELNKEAAEKGYEMTDSEWYARLAWEETCKERDELKYQVKALSAIRKGLETSLKEALEKIEAQEKEIEELTRLSEF